MPAKREIQGYPGASLRRWGDGERAAQRLHPLHDRRDAVSVAVPRQPYAVIRDMDSEGMVLRFQSDRAPLGPAMLDNIGHGFPDAERKHRFFHAG